jgi:acetamidase/formamidase/AraC-like DNA-binding protein
MSLRVETSSIPSTMRPNAWQQGLNSIGLCGDDGEFAAADGNLAILPSSSGAYLAQIAGGAQGLMPQRDKGDGHVVFFTVNQGSASLTTDKGIVPISNAELLVLTRESHWRIDWRCDFEAIFFGVPRSRIQTRLGRSRIDYPLVLAETASAAAARAALQSLGGHLDHIGQADLNASESALVELVVSAMLSETKSKFGPMTHVQAAHFRRILAAIDTKLSCPSLCIGDVARQERLSLRYVQRLFELRNESFSDYVRRQRLEGSRTDLIDPNHSDESVSDIAWRWGFRNQAHFSRSFSVAFGVPPSATRPHSRSQRPDHPHRGTPPKRAAASSVEIDPSSVRIDGQSWPSDATDIERAYLPVNSQTVHWGYLSETIPPVLHVKPGAVVTVETLTQHAGDDVERMILGDPAAEAVFQWTSAFKAVNRRGAGPLDASIFGRGAGEGFGVHICTGPIFVIGAEPGDFLEVEFLSVRPRPCGNPAHRGRAYASNVSAWWGFQYNDLLDRRGKRETVTIYEIDLDDPSYARPLYSYEWTTQTDPFGVQHRTIDYPGVMVDPSSITAKTASRGVRIPARPHFGFVAVAPRERGLVDSIPPSIFGGNLDNWRLGEGARIYLPVAVAGALLSIGDGHFAQGDAEINGTGLECSLTAEIRVRLHKAGDSLPKFLRGLNTPLIETESDWIIQAFSYQNYLRELGRHAQSDVYARSTIDMALRSAFRQARRFLMDAFDLTEDEALSVMSLASDFGVTQTADGNLGVHATIPKVVFSQRERM